MIDLPDISLRQLHYLVAVADEPTWAAAATVVGVSPSALSQGLAELERRVGVELFESHGRRRVLRQSATPVLEHARRVVALTRDLVDWSDRMREARSGRVRLGMIDVAAVVHYPAVLREFRLLHPDVDLTLSVAPSSALLDDLRAGRLDLVVCVEPPRGLAGVDVIAMRREPLCVMAPPGTVIAEPGRWGPWLTFPTGSHTRHLIVERLRELGAPLSIAAESHQPDVLREMVGIGLGWTVLPLDPSFQVGDLVVGPAILERDLVLARRSDSVHDPAADELAARLGEAAATTALVERGL